jgi:CDP-diacylglycerol--glycerol-3-phosphate 3-phosphatidyltransferase
MHTITLPTIITLVRLIASPLILPFVLVYGLSSNIPLLNYGLAVLFVFLALTDFFDGYLARRWGQVSALGKTLDPLADKFLVYATLVALLASNKIYFYWVVIFIGRDFFMMGLRQIALEQGFGVPVSRLGKFKTALLLSYLTWVIANPYQGQWDAHVWWNGIELLLLVSSLVLTIWSTKNYYHSFVKMYTEMRPPTHMWTASLR